MAALESIFVTLIVAGCAVFSIWRLISVRMRLKVLQMLATLPRYAGGDLVADLRRKTIARLSGGCGTCSRAVNGVNATFQHANQRPAAPRR
jgi:hypothetical protein